MHRALSATLGVAALLVVAPAAQADSNVIVKYKSGAAAQSKSAAAERAGQKAVLGTVAANGAQIVRVAGDAKAAAAILNRSAAVEYAEPDVELTAFGIPNDARFGE